MLDKKIYLKQTSDMTYRCLEELRNLLYNKYLITDVDFIVKKSKSGLYEDFLIIEKRINVDITHDSKQEIIADTLRVVREYERKRIKLMNWQFV